MFLIIHAHVHGSSKCMPKCMLFYDILNDIIVSLHDIMSLLKKQCSLISGHGTRLVLYLGGAFGAILVLSWCPILDAQLKALLELSWCSILDAQEEEA
jgi:hypothetical protein